LARTAVTPGDGTDQRVQSFMFMMMMMVMGHPMKNLKITGSLCVHMETPQSTQRLSAKISKLRLS
jgi:hypothetical protein